MVRGGEGRSVLLRLYLPPPTLTGASLSLSPSVLYRKMVSYLLLRSGLGSATDIAVVREASGEGCCAPPACLSVTWHAHHTDDLCVEHLYALNDSVARTHAHTHTHTHTHQPPCRVCFPPLSWARSWPCPKQRSSSTWWSSRTLSQGYGSSTGSLGREGWGLMSVSREGWGLCLVIYSSVSLSVCHDVGCLPAALQCRVS